MMFFLQFSGTSSYFHAIDYTVTVFTPQLLFHLSSFVLLCCQCQGPYLFIFFASFISPFFNSLVKWISNIDFYSLLLSFYIFIHHLIQNNSAILFLSFIPLTSSPSLFFIFQVSLLTISISTGQIIWVQVAQQHQCRGAWSANRGPSLSRNYSQGWTSSHRKGWQQGEV